MKTIVISIIMLIAAVSLPVSAETLYVPADYSTIQSAIDTANDGDTVLIAPGTYTGDGNRDIDFLGKAITVRSVDPNDPNIVAGTIIDCNGSPDEPHRGFYFHSGEDANSVLSGLTITNGYARGDYLQGGGGAICCEAASPELSKCTLTKNSATFGGGISCEYSSPKIMDCRLIDNDAYSEGGGIGCNYGSPEIVNCLITANSAWHRGGGMCLFVWEGSLLRVANCVVTRNIAEKGSACYFGGGYAYRPGKCIFTNCTFADNILVCKGVDSPIVLDTDRGIITNCIVWNNLPSRMSLHNTVVSHCDIQYGWPGEGNIDIDPRFASEGDYHLSHISPCIDAGTNDPCGGLPAADIDGADRIIDGDHDAVAVVDMGAYEHNPASPLLAVSLPSDLLFRYAQGYEIPEAKSLFIANAGDGTLSWKIIEDCNWLTVYPTQGQTTTRTDQVKISVEPLSLDLGEYTCSFQVASPNALNSPVTVEITLQVGRLLRVPEDFNTIQEAIDVVYYDRYDTVLVADGVYTGDGNRDIRIYEAPITIRSENGPENCIIDCNGSEQNQHFAFCIGSHPSFFNNLMIEGFTITNGYNGRGGGIDFIWGTDSIKNCIFTNNTATDRGGAIYIHGVGQPISPTFINCVFLANKSSSGGAVSASMCSTTFIDCSFHQNIADFDGGALYCTAGFVEAKLTNCTFTGNRAGRIGGAISLGFGVGQKQLTNCLIAGNRAGDYGGGLNYLTYPISSISVSDCTIADNFVPDPKPLYAEQLTATNTIFADSESGLWYIDDSPNITFSNIRGGWEGEGNIDAEPCFVRPGYWADVNDVNVVVEPNEPNAVWVDGDYRLLADSACIDAGEPDYLGAAGETDLNGKPRVVDGDKDGLGRIDMGAYEYAPPIEARIRIMPRVLNLRSRGRWVLCKITLPGGYNVGDIDRGSILLEGQIEPGRVFASERLKAAIALFSRAELSAILQPGRVELAVTGRLKDGTEFEGTASIRVIPADRRGRHPQEK